MMCSITMEGGCRSFAGDLDLAIMGTFYRTCKGGALHIFSINGKKRTCHILQPQSDRRLIHYVTVHQRPEVLPWSDKNIVSARVRLFIHFALKNRIERQQATPVESQLLKVDASLLERLTRKTGDRFPSEP